MNLSIRHTLFASSLLTPILAIMVALSSAVAIAGPITTTLPDTVAGKIGATVITHINADTPESIQKWGPTFLSTSVDAESKTALLKQLATAVRDSGGVDFVDARTQGPPGMLVVTIKGRRTAPVSRRGALFNLALPYRLYLLSSGPSEAVIGCAGE
jgi:D-alanyl-D-alanine carboxypeptidase